MMSAPDKRASTNQSKIQVNVAAAYKKDATLVDIFDGHVQPGREFLDLILSFYKAQNLLASDSLLTDVSLIYFVYGPLALRQ